MMVQLDQRRASYGEVVNEFSKYLQNFENYCSEEPMHKERKANDFRGGRISKMS